MELFPVFAIFGGFFLLGVALFVFAARMVNWAWDWSMPSLKKFSQYVALQDHEPQVPSWQRAFVLWSIRVFAILISATFALAFIFWVLPNL